MKQNFREELKAKKQAYVQEEITAAAADLFASAGYRAVTIDEIAAKLGYTKSVVYYYFQNKNEVLWTIFEQINTAWAHDMDDILASAAAPREMLWAMVRKHALNVLERTAWTAIYFREQGSLTEDQMKIVEQRKSVYNDRFREVYKRGVQQGIACFDFLARQIVTPFPVLFENIADKYWAKSPIGGQRRAEFVGV